MSTALLPLNRHSTEFLLRQGPCAVQMHEYLTYLCSTIYVWAPSLRFCTTEVQRSINTIKIGTVTMFNFCPGMWLTPPPFAVQDSPGTTLTPPPFADSSPPPQWRAGWRGKVCSTWGCPWCSAQSHPATRTPWEAHPLCPSSRYSCHYPATEKETWWTVSKEKVLEVRKYTETLRIKTLPFFDGQPSYSMVMCALVPRPCPPDFISSVSSTTAR